MFRDFLSRSEIVNLSHCVKSFLRLAPVVKLCPLTWEKVSNDLCIDSQPLVRGLQVLPRYFLRSVLVREHARYSLQPHIVHSAI